MIRDLDHGVAVSDMCLPDPGVALFATTLPYTVEVVLGQKNNLSHRAGILLSSCAATIWLAYPLL